MSRLTRDAWAMGLAELTARRGTCLRRQVGCVLLNERGHVLSTGYNGVAAGVPHCNEVGRVSPAGPDYVPFPDDPIGHPNACPGAHAKSGTNLDGCHALHAEQNGKSMHDLHEVVAQHQLPADRVPRGVPAQ